MLIARKRTQAYNLNMHKHDGFTIVELVIVIIVMAILATIGGLAWRETRNNALDSQQKANVLTLKNAIERYKKDYGIFPQPDCTTDHYGNIMCLGGELASDLTPRYINSLPTSNNQSTPQHFSYYVNEDGSSYALHVTLSSGGCKSGVNMPVDWFWSAPECSF